MGIGERVAAQLISEFDHPFIKNMFQVVSFFGTKNGGLKKTIATWLSLLKMKYQSSPENKYTVVQQKRFATVWMLMDGFEREGFPHQIPEVC